MIDRLFDWLLHMAAVLLFMLAIGAAWLVFNDPIGHAYLCDVPGSKVCS